MPLHLLFPLFSSVVFVIGMMFARQAISRGASPWTGTFLANLWLGISWLSVELSQPGMLPLAGWWQAALVGFSFVLGQLFTYLAFRYGDVSVATPVFGVKVIIVAGLLAWLAGEQISGRIWLGAILATIGVGVIQAGARSTESAELTTRRAVFTIVPALLAAVSLSLFDAGLQIWGSAGEPLCFCRPCLFQPEFFRACFCRGLTARHGCDSWECCGHWLSARCSWRCRP